ncbi:MAG: protein translocase SEC61 complex subunit gamma [Candidatus Diapherotrites archaeon]|nr:protein translocase SEC61 complex subunit gamma [Candidatus Diapherotrites archaeon]
MNPIQSLRNFFSDSKRVLAIAKKPKSNEYKGMVKIVGIGIIILSLVGYIVFLVFTITKLGGAQ